MNHELFEQIVVEEFEKAIPERYRKLLSNVDLLIDDEPSEEILRDRKVPPGDTLLGLYQGVAVIDRGGDYGIGLTLPDTITLYRRPIIEETIEQGGGEESFRRIIRETIWHEVAHHFGFNENQVNMREKEGTNRSL